MILPLGVGVLLGAGAAYALRVNGKFEAAAGPVLLVAVAVFWPVFAFDDGTIFDKIFHSTTFAGFAVLAFMSRTIGPVLIGLGLLAHAGFDGLLIYTSPPGPVWWPAFCAGFDLILGTAWLVIGTRK